MERIIPAGGRKVAIEELEWDSELFGYNVGKCVVHTVPFYKKELKNLDGFDLVYIYSQISISNKYLSKEFTKVTFCRNIGRIENPKEILLNSKIKLYKKGEDEGKLLDLAFQSGKYSRFKLDPKFKNKEFEKLYSKWIRRSIDGEITDLVLVYKTNDVIHALLTLSIESNKARIGLLAVDHGLRQQGVGSDLLHAAVCFANKNNCTKLFVATQKANEHACGFYRKNGFQEAKQSHIYHLWNK